MLDGVIASNPCRDVRTPRAPRRADEPWTYLDAAEQDALFRAADEAHRDILRFAVGTGLRGGEQWCLQPADLHVDGDHPHVYVRFGSPNRPPKSGKPRRVPLFGHGLDGARSWLRRGIPTRNDHGVVFPGERGGRRKVSRYPAGWSEWLAAAGIDRRVRWHDLRHTTGAALVSGWWGRAWRLEEVRDHLGHADIRTTQRYAHLAPSALDAAARATDDVTAGLRLAYGSKNSIDSDALERGVSDGIGQQSERSRGATSPLGPRVGQAAVDLLDCAAGRGSGDVGGAIAALVSAVLSSDAVRLAGAAAAPGPHRLDRAIELAGLVLGAVDCRSGSRGRTRARPNVQRLRQV